MNLYKFFTYINTEIKPFNFKFMYRTSERLNLFRVKFKNQYFDLCFHFDDYVHNRDVYVYRKYSNKYRNYNFNEILVLILYI